MPARFPLCLNRRRFSVQTEERRGEPKRPPPVLGAALRPADDNFPAFPSCTGKRFLRRTAADVSAAVRLCFDCVENAAFYAAGLAQTPTKRAEDDCRRAWRRSPVRIVSGRGCARSGREAWERQPDAGAESRSRRRDKRLKRTPRRLRRCAERSWRSGGRARRICGRFRRWPLRNATRTARRFGGPPFLNKGLHFILCGKKAFGCRKKSFFLFRRRPVRPEPTPKTKHPKPFVWGKDGRRKKDSRGIFRGCRRFFILQRRERRPCI